MVLHRVALMFQQRLGLARAPRQFVDDVLRQARRQAAPGRRQQVDEELFAGRHGVHGHALRQRDANGLAVGIAPRRADIVGRLFRHAVNRHIERLLEADDQHIAGLARGAVDIFARGEHQCAHSRRRWSRSRGLDRRRNWCRGDCRRRKRQEIREATAAAILLRRAKASRRPEIRMVRPHAMNNSKPTQTRTRPTARRTRLRGRCVVPRRRPRCTVGGCA